MLYELNDASTEIAENTAVAEDVRSQAQQATNPNIARDLDRAVDALDAESAQIQAKAEAQAEADAAQAEAEKQAKEAEQAAIEAEAAQRQADRT